MGFSLNVLLLLGDLLSLPGREGIVLKNLFLVHVLKRDSPSVGSCLKRGVLKQNFKAQNGSRKKKLEGVAGVCFYSLPRVHYF